MDIQKKVIYNFGGYSVDVAERQTRRGDKLIPLTPKAFETLVILLENRGKVLDKNFLLDRIWANTFVGEATLAQNISTLRKTFGSLKNGNQLIETVSGRGYRFIADVREINADQEIIIVERRVSSKVTSEYEEMSDRVVINQANQTLPKTTSVKEGVFIWIKSNKRLAIGMIACSLLLGLISLLRFATHSSFSTNQFKDIELSMLTSDGVSNRIAVSPDGKYIAMVKAENQKRSIQIRQIDSSATIEVLPPQDILFHGLTFSPDGKEIYYVTLEPIKSTYSTFGTLYRIPMLGGTPQLIVSDVDSPITISPDGLQYAFIRDYQHENESALMIGSFNEVSEPKKLSVRDIKSGFSYGGLSWSPDGKLIVCGGFTDEKPRRAELLSVDVSNGEQGILTDTKWQRLGQPVWLADGSGVIISGINLQSENQSEDLWMITYPNGTIRQVTKGINSSLGLSITADSKTIVTVKTTHFANYWVSDTPNLGTPIRLTQNPTDSSSIPNGLSWTADGKILFGLTLNGNMDIWRMNADGSDRRQITFGGGVNTYPSATRDGRFIVFVSNRSGIPNLWRIRPDGSDPIQLTNENYVSSPSVTSDGNSIYYTSLDEQAGKPFLRRINIGGGVSTQITSLPTMAPKVSPDGKLIVCYFPQVIPDPSANGDLKLTVLRAQTGEVIRQYDQLFGESNMGSISWSSDQTFIYSTLENELSRMWEQSSEKEKPRLLGESSADFIFGFAYWNEGKKLAFGKVVTLNDVVAISSVVRPESDMN